MKIDKVTDSILNYIQNDNMYLEALSIDDADDLESYFYDCDIDFLGLLDEAINIELEGIDTNSLVNSLDENLKFQLAKNYIEEYDDNDDLNKSFAYYYLQYEFMLNLTDSILLGAYEDIVLSARDMQKEVLSPIKIDILSVLNKYGFKLPTENNPLSDLEFNKGYLLCYIHTKLSYDEQFYALNILQNYTDDNWSKLLTNIYNNGVNTRNTMWFKY